MMFLILGLIVAGGVGYWLGLVVARRLFNR
jgi:hypothetical protein